MKFGLSFSSLIGTLCSLARTNTPSPIMKKLIKSGNKVEILWISTSLSTKNLEARLFWEGVPKWFVAWNKKYNTFISIQRNHQMRVFCLDLTKKIVNVSRCGIACLIYEIHSWKYKTDLWGVTISAMYLIFHHQMYCNIISSLNDMSHNIENILP